MTVKKVCKQVRGNKIVPNKKGDIDSIPPFLCPLFYLEQIFLPSLVIIIIIFFVIIRLNFYEAYLRNGAT